MTLIKTSLLNGVAVIIKILTLLGLNKILAIYVGPAGYAAIGQFQNAVQMITTFASGALSTGVTKYTAEYYDDEQRQHTVWRTAGTIALIGSISTAVLVAISSEYLAGWFLSDDSLGSIFVWFSITLVFFVFNALLLAILNGKKEIKRYVVANIAGSIFSLFVTSLLVINFGLYGALVSLAIHQSLTFFVTLFLTYKTDWFRFNYLFGQVDKGAAKNLSKYMLMALTGAACVPISHMLIRNHLGESLGWEAAGYWEGMWRLSSAYLMVVTTTLSVYYLPKLSELNNPHDIRREIKQGYKIILPIAIVAAVTIYCLRDFIIKVLFTEDFLEMEKLFAWQLIGDTLKISSWLLGYVLTAKALFKLFIVSEVMFSFSFYGLVYFLTNDWGIEATSIAHAINYLFHLIFLSLSLKVLRIV